MTRADRWSHSGNRSTIIRRQLRADVLPMALQAVDNEGHSWTGMVITSAGPEERI